MESHPKHSLLARIENISKASYKCELNLNTLDSLKEDIQAVADFLSVSLFDVVLFSVIADLGLQRTITPEKLSKHFNCSVLRVMDFIQRSDMLVKKGLIKKAVCRKSLIPSASESGYTVPVNVIEAILKEDHSRLFRTTKIDLPSFLKQISEIIDEREEGNLSTNQVLEETEFLISLNNHLPFVTYVDKGLKSGLSKATVFAFSYSRFRGKVPMDIVTYANTLFDDLGGQLEFSQQLSAGTHELVKNGFLRILKSEFDGDKSAALSFETASRLYQSYPELLVTETETSGLMLYKTIKSKRLVFNNSMKEQLGMLEEVLGQTRFRAYCRQLERNGLNRGITVIFSGEPGTGKTEEVFQLARKTKRDIMMVDLSEMRSKWFGDSEKKVRQVFEDYASVRKARRVEHILLINEADGFLTRRVNLALSNEVSDRVTNTMQNVLLQALESFEGILIATTNLTGNLDRAYERRFTFKVSFPQPDKQVRRMIWKDKLPELTDDEAARLGESFEISGGEIDNQVRQVLLRRVLNRKGDLFASLNESCRNVKGFTPRKKVGFGK